MKITEELWNSESAKLTITTNKVISLIDVHINVFRRITKKDGIIFTIPKWAYTNLPKNNLEKISNYIKTEITKKYYLTPANMLGNTKTDITNLGLTYILDSCLGMILQYI